MAANTISNTVQEKVPRALCSLAVAPGRIRERLARAYVEHLSGLDPSWFPDRLRHQFISIRDAITSTDRPVAEAVEAMTEDTACEIAQKIISLEDDLRSLLAEGE